MLAAFALLFLVDCVQGHRGVPDRRAHVAVVKQAEDRRPCAEAGPRANTRALEFDVLCLASLVEVCLKTGHD